MSAWPAIQMLLLALGAKAECANVEHSLVLGGMMQREHPDHPVSSTIEMITPSVVCTPDMPPLPLATYAAAAQLLGSRLFYCGGDNGDHPPYYEDTCHSFLLGEESNQWEEEASMNQARKYFGLTEVGETLFATGGMGEVDVYHNTVESYSRESGWTVQEGMEMKSYRWKHCAAAINTVLLIIGGDVKSGDSTSVEAFDTSSSGGWESRASMPTARVFHACHVGQLEQLNGVYVAGGQGRSGEPALDSVDFYFAELDTWTTLGPMTSPRYTLSLTVVNGLMTAAGGYDWHTLETVEVLEQGEWVRTNSLSTTRYFHAAVTIPAGLLNCKVF